jgi:cytochrome c-type biogenesis protein CcmH
MSRWVGFIGLGLLIAVVGLILLRPGAAAPTDAQRAEAVAAELRCPDCAGLSVADSHTASAVEMRRQIAELIDAGETDAAIRDRFVDSYGEWVLLQPSTPAFWVIPLAVAVAGVVALGLWLGRRPPAADAPQPPELDARTRQQLHDEIEALDA